MVRNSIGARKIASILLTVALSGACVSVFAAPAGASVVAVGHGDLSPACAPTTNWYSSDDVTCGTGDVSFVSGPSTPPSGIGSARIATALSSDRSLIANLDPAYGGIRFDAITNLQYSTYRSSVDAGNNLAIALQFDVDYDVTDAVTPFQGRLVFEPYQTFPGGVPQNTWQTWSPLTGKWWGSSTATSSSPPKVGGATAAQLCPQASPCTWAQVLADYPNAGLRPAPNNRFLFKAGSSWPGFVGNVDDFTIGVSGTDTTYDFEPIYCTTDCYVSPTGSDSNSGFSNDPFKTVQKGVDTVSTGGTVHVAAGTYSEQVVVNKAVTITGAGQATTTIQGPATMTTSCVSAIRAVVAVCGSNGSTVVLSGVTISGGVGGEYSDGGCGGPRMIGAFVSDSETLNVSQSTVTNVYPTSPSSYGCQTNAGLAVLIGRQSLGLVGNLIADHLSVQHYQKGGIVIDGPGSTGTITNSSVTGDPAITPFTAMNGIQIGRGASASVDSTTVSGNQCLLATVCGPDPLNNTQSAGILVFDDLAATPVPTISLTNNIVTGNDMGIYSNALTGTTTISGNTLSGNDEGVLLDEGSALVTNNSITSNGTAPFGAGVFAVQGSGSKADTTATLTGNTISGNPTGLEAIDVTADAFTTHITVQRNALTANPTTSLDNEAASTVTATCNWWGAATGPGAGAVSGSGPVTTADWLTSSNLAGTCPQPPTVSVSLDAPPNGNAGWFKSIPVTGTVTADDTLTGGSNITSIDCNVAIVPTGIGTPVASATFSISAQGSTSVSCTATDAAGSTSSPTGTSAMVDTIAPSGSVTIDGGAASTTNTSATLGISATDANGVTAYRVANGSDCSSATWVPVTSTTSLSTATSFTLTSGVGTKTVCAQFEDVAGNDSTTATATISLIAVVEVTTGNDHTCARMTDGTAMCWGSNAFGQLGDGTTTNRSLPVVVQNHNGTGPLTGITQIAAGARHTCVLLSSGAARCWGDNSSGQLGDGTTTGESLPGVVKGSSGFGSLTGIAQLAISGVYSCARFTDGTASCWGGNGGGQLGDGTITSRTLPVTVLNHAGTGALAAITQISARGVHTCVVLTGGAARCWGSNAGGQLGDGTTTNEVLPVVVKNSAGTGSLTGVIGISSGNNSTCAVLSGGTAVCWGMNGSGQLGDGTTTDRLLPVAVLNHSATGALTGIAQISAGSVHACAQLTSGAPRCWGDNTYGQLGDGTTINELLPVVVKTGVATTQISARNVDTCATLPDGTARCWGGNPSGELGDGTTTNRSQPVLVVMP